MTEYQDLKNTPITLVHLNGLEAKDSLYKDEKIYDNKQEPGLQIASKQVVREMPLRQTVEPVAKNTVDIAFLVASNNNSYTNNNTINNSIEDIEKELNMMTKEDLSARHNNDSGL